MPISRRFFLQSSGAMAAYLGVTPLTALAEPVAQLAAKPNPVAEGKTLVVIFLRGGIDGLNLIVPYADPGYAKLRKDLLIKRPGQENGCIDLDGYFGLHPRAKALMPLFDQGTAVAAQAVGYPHNTRSHFEEQDRWETGVVGNTLGADGWLNRHLLTSTGRGPVRAVAIGPTLPRILRGDAPAFAIRGLTDLGLPQNADTDAVAAALEHAYHVDPTVHADPAQEARQLVQQTGAETLEALRLIRQVTEQDYTPAATYPEKNPLSSPLASAARLIKANIGVEIIELDYGGWDTHRNQGVGIQGGYGDRLQRLANALAAFTEDLGPQLDNTLILTLSDFGRTAAQNGSRGTDHGWANAMLALGGPVANAGEPTGIKQRRKVLTDWPGLLPEQLHQKRDLQHTTDFRDVLAEVVGTHLGNPNLTRVIPGREFSPVGLVA
ncbi:MAG: DUF1501 domain-containing protein [Planctomycetota bacterium]